MSDWSRREFCQAAAGASAAFLSQTVSNAAEAEFKFNYILGSCLYGYMSLGEILPEVAKVGATAIDLWPKVHGNQREQLDDLGEERFRVLLDKHGVKLGCLTQYKLGPFGLQEEFKLAQRFGCPVIVTGAVGPKGLTGDELKREVGKFIEQLKPHLDVAAECGVTVAIENHGHNLIDSPDALKWLMEFRPNAHLGVALAPYHLPQEPELLSQLIRDLGEGIVMFYAWQHGQGCMTKLPKDQELLQLPGRGNLDFGPLVQALREIRYSGWTEIFMHPVPRGVPILETTSQVTETLNESRAYLNRVSNPG